MDDADMAQQRQEIELDRAVEAARRSGGHGADDPVLVCMECGNEIEPPRIALGLLVCVDCARWREQQAMRTRGRL